MTDAAKNSRSRITSVLIIVVAAAFIAVLFHKKQTPSSQPPERDDPSLLVETEPAGASLLVNGKLVGSTPIRIDGLAPGKYGVRLEKEGCEPVALKVDFGRTSASVKRKMDPVPTGSLNVTITPDGSEVVLDGDVVGCTPLTLERVSTGAHQLLVRKTNYDSYSAVIAIKAGERSTYSGFELHSQILAMLEGYVKREPQRVSHYIDLAHFHFVNDHLDKAVETFAQAMEINSTPLNFDGPGYPGKENVSDAEMSQDERLRKYDDARLLKEVDKHKNWPGKDCREFRQKLDQAQEMAITKSGASWELTYNTALNAVKRKDFDRAALLYRKHIASLPANSPDAPRAYAALLEVYLTQRDMTLARAQFNTFYELYDKDADAMLRYSETLVKFTESTVNKKELGAIYEMAEKALRRAVAITDTGKGLGQCQALLGKVLVDTGHAEEAVGYLQKAVAAAVFDAPVLEARYFSLANALWKAGRVPEAHAIYEKLAASNNATTRETAKLGLARMANDKSGK